MPSLPVIASVQCGVFSVHQARDSGWTQGALRHAVRSGRLLRPRVGAYQIADLSELADGPADEFERARWRHAAPAVAAVLMTPGSLASHSTAAVLHGLPLLFLPPRACVSVAPEATGSVPKVHLHRCTAAPPRRPVAFLGTTGVVRTVIDLAREHGPTAGVVAADFALHTGMTTRDDLDAGLLACTRWPGVTRAREAIASSDHRSESVLETRSRLAIREWGLPTPRLQARIGNSCGGFVARVDFFWPEFGVVGEADGEIKYGGTAPVALVAEKRRQGLLEDLELGVVRWSHHDLRDFGAVAARLRRAFARGLRTPPSAQRWVLLPAL